MSVHIGTTVNIYSVLESVAILMMVVIFPIHEHGIPSHFNSSWEVVGIQECLHFFKFLLLCGIEFLQLISVGPVKFYIFCHYSFLDTGLVLQCCLFVSFSRGSSIIFIFLKELTLSLILGLLFN